MVVIGVDRQTILLALAVYVVSGCVAAPQVTITVSNQTASAIQGHVNVRFVADHREVLNTSSAFDIPSDLPHSLQHVVSAHPGAQRGNLTVTVSIANGTTATHAWTLVPLGGETYGYYVFVLSRQNVTFATPIH